MKTDKEELLAYFKDDEKKPHLSSSLGISRYLKMADEIKKILPSGKILDWGAGTGQMTFLLARRGLDVASYDIASADSSILNNIKRTIQIGRHPSKLPFASAEFDGVLSSGVLEHVENEKDSLKEIKRVLKDKGIFFVYMLPNQFSYIEFVSDRMGRGDHKVKYYRSKIKAVLEAEGFQVLSIRYQNFFPYNFKGFPPAARNFYHFFDPLIGFLDNIFTNLPLINIFSTNLCVIAKKK